MGGLKSLMTARLRSLLRATAGLRVLTALNSRWQRVTRRNRVTVLSLTALAVVAIGWLVLSPGKQEQPRARQYLAFKACLLTDSHGITGREAAPVWQGMQNASLKTRTRVQYLPAFGPATVPNALPYLASLVQRHCDLVMAAGDIPVNAALTDAGRYPTARFVVVGSSAARRNVTVVRAPSAEIPAAVAGLVIDAVHRTNT